MAHPQPLDVDHVILVGILSKPNWRYGRIATKLELPLFGKAPFVPSAVVAIDVRQLRAKVGSQADIG